MALMSLAVKVVAEAVAEEPAGAVEVEAVAVSVSVSVQLHAMRSHRMVKLWMERRLRLTAAVASR